VGWTQFITSRLIWEQPGEYPSTGQIHDESQPDIDLQPSNAQEDAAEGCRCGYQLLILSSVSAHCNLELREAGMLDY
jgi:hypothetical protein